MITAAQAAAMPPRMRDLYEFYRHEPSTAGLDFTYDVERDVLAFHVPAGANGMCDFCPGTAGPYSVWDAVDDTMLTGEQTGDGIPHGSIGAWLACIDCTPLIAGADREGLARRVIRLLPFHERAIPEIRAAIILAHDAFWRAKR